MDCLVKKTKKSLQKHKAKTVLLGGGVTANRLLRKKIEDLNVKTYLPIPQLCGDNAAMIGIASLLNIKEANAYDFPHYTHKTL